MNSRSMRMLVLLGLGLMGSPLFAADTESNQARQAVPGTVNYVEGAVNLSGSQLSVKSVGSATIGAGQQIATGHGKAELLLTPGVFLRMDDNSTVKMMSPDLAMTQVELDRGRAGIEVDEIHQQNDLQVIDNGITTRLNKRGYYEFDANRPQVKVFKGEAHVEVNDDKWERVKGDRELALNEGPELAQEKPQKFNESDAKDELYDWNSLRSEYMAEANNQMASQYTGSYTGPGWYWDPWSFGYAYMGLGPFASPFGWGYYPFGWGGFYPYWGGYYGHQRIIRHGDEGVIHHGYVGGAIRGNPGNFENFHNSRGFEGFHNSGNFEGFHGGFAGGQGQPTTRSLSR